MPIDWSEQNDALGEARGRLTELDDLATKFGNSLSRAFAHGIASGKSFDDVLRNVGMKFIELGVNAALKPATNLLSGLFGQISGAFGGQVAGAGAMPITPFADGGVIAAPGYFPLGRGLGLAGEAGPEAILPLARGSDGTLGVAASGASGGATVNVTIMAQDLDSFQRSEAQVSAALMRAVSRGRRGT